MSIFFIEKCKQLFWQPRVFWDSWDNVNLFWVCTVRFGGVGWGTTGAASLRRCQKLSPCLREPMPEALANAQGRFAAGQGRAHKQQWLNLWKNLRTGEKSPNNNTAVTTRERRQNMWEKQPCRPRSVQKVGEEMLQRRDSPAGVGC